ncbi:MAG: acyl-CoA thioesterase [Spirochaetaceae bacterium]|nr:acyl-CoA thioesterase [Spirochaetaceae bacterium]
MKSTRKFFVRTYECDSYSHVNNAVYLNYLEAGRYEFLKDIGFDYNAAVGDGYGMYIARVEIDYKKPAFVDDELTIETWPLKTGAVSGIVGQKITRGSDIIIDAKVTWAFVDKSGTPAKMPEKYSVAGFKPENLNL